MTKPLLRGDTRYYYFFSKENRAIWCDNLDEINLYICQDLSLPAGGLRVTDSRPEIQKSETTIIFIVYSKDGTVNIHQKVVGRIPKKKLCSTEGCLELEKFKCGRCEKVTYCSRECQRTDWANHKQSCSKKAES